LAALVFISKIPASSNTLGPWVRCFELKIVYPP
jgi:hypothetical protein